MPDHHGGILKSVARVEIVCLLDNYVDLLLGSTDIVTRPPLSKNDTLPTETLIAEHGLSLLITVYSGDRHHTILFDTGYNAFGVLHNLGQLDLDLDDLEAIVLSHGHMDHTGSLDQILQRINRPVSLVAHPQAFRPGRFLGRKAKGRLAFPQTLNQSRLEALGVDIRETALPAPLADGTVLVSGEVARVTSFEKGFPDAVMVVDGQINTDPIADDQCLVMHLAGKGLVVVSGCAHAGIVNTLTHCRKLTGIETIYAVFGGFHLTGPAFEPIIEETIAALKPFAPQIMVPMHCTGWQAIKRLSEAFPDAFILNSVGSKYGLT